MICISKSLAFLDASECIVATAMACGVEFFAYSLKDVSKAASRLQRIEKIEAESCAAAGYACIGAELCEKRSLCIINDDISEVLAFCSSVRLPVVFVNYSQKIFKDSAAIQFFPENNQELIDYIVLAYRLAEDRKIMLPVIVNFFDAGLREVVQVPTQQSAEKIIPKLRLVQKISKEAVYLMERKNKQQANAALQQTEPLLKKVSEQFWQRFRRKVGYYETYMAEDADHILVTAGINTINSRNVITTMRAEGKKVGLLKIKILNTYDIKKIVDGKNVGLVDFAPGLRDEVYNPVFVVDRALLEKDFEEVFRKLAAGGKGTYWV